MPEYVTEVIIWTCVGAFVICMVCGLLIVTGLWEPKDQAVKKWLLGTVLFAVVGAVAAFAARQFAVSDNGSREQPEQNITQPKTPTTHRPGNNRSLTPRHTPAPQ